MSIALSFHDIAYVSQIWNVWCLHCEVECWCNQLRSWCFTHFLNSLYNQHGSLCPNSIPHWHINQMDWFVHSTPAGLYWFTNSTPFSWVNWLLIEIYRLHNIRISGIRLCYNEWRWNSMFQSSLVHCSLLFPYLMFLFAWRGELLRNTQSAWLGSKNLHPTKDESGSNSCQIAHYKPYCLVICFLGWIFHKHWAISPFYAIISNDLEKFKCSLSSPNHI